jgi:hypothetical protein
MFTTSPCDRTLAKPVALFSLLVILFLATSGIGGEKEVPVTGFQYGESSPTSLAQAVLHTIAEADLAGMQKLWLSKEEFRDLVWPELPVSNPKTNISLDFVWNDLSFRSRSHMLATFRLLKDRKLTLVQVRHLGKVTEYPHHKAYSNMEVILREAGSEEKPYPLFGTLIERNGRWKVYSYAPYH